MPKDNRSRKLLIFVFLVLIASFFAAFYAFTWTEPAAAPPDGNVSAPLNVSATAQGKTGSLGVGISTPVSRLHIKDGQTWGSDLSVDATGTAGGRRWMLISTGGTAAEGQGKFLIKDNNAGDVRFTIDDAGNVGIGTTSPLVIPGGYASGNLTVRGRIHIIDDDPLDPYAERLNLRKIIPFSVVT